MEGRARRGPLRLAVSRLPRRSRSSPPALHGRLPPRLVGPRSRCGGADAGQGEDLLAAGPARRLLRRRRGPPALARPGGRRGGATGKDSVSSFHRLAASLLVLGLLPSLAAAQT